ncbi:ABC transporter substrate-binding protein [Halarcobacter sp.]|uniref:transporter substrate-binding domain-containing diguanylate cyclase n=1 Tax=Halarcobacter sp. TaxID=2321133 RepID=UPI003AFFD8F3
MNIYKIFLLISLLFNTLVLQAKEEKISIQLDWLHQFQFAGYYIAKEKGYFKEENLDVRIKEFDFDVDLVNGVLNSKASYAVGKSSLIIDRLEGKKVVLLAAIYQNSPMVLISLNNSNIKKIKDLKDKKVMLTPDARSAAAINSMIISQGLNLKDINFQQHSFKLEDLISGKTDAMGCYLSNEPYILDSKNIEFKIHNPSEYGFEFYGGLFFTSQEELRQNPIRVRKMHRAVLKGWKYAFENIDETVKIIYEKYNTQNKSLEALKYEAKILKELAQFEEGNLGNIDYKKVEEIKRLYLLLGLSDSAINFKLEDIIYNPKKINLTQEEKKYIRNYQINLISNSNFPPFTIETDNKLSGIEIDYWNLVRKKLNLISAIEVINNNQEANEKINTNANNLKYAFGTVDYENINSNMSMSVDKIKLALTTLVDKPYTTAITELANKKIAITKYASYYKDLKKKYPKINFVETASINESFDLLQANKVYGILGKLPALSYNITKKTISNAKISGIYNENYELRLHVNKENRVLLNILNKAISTITDEERKLIRDKYNSIIYEPEKDYSWVYKIIAFLSVLIIIVVINNRKLNKEIKKRKLAEEELSKIAHIDGLTNAFSRRKIESILELELNREKRYNRGLSLIFFDVDNFKLINDQLGHSTGDNVLEKISSLVNNTMRKTDSFGRWGGEEFIIILPETNKVQAKNIAYLLKEKIANFDFEIDRKVTCSFGVSQFEETDCADSLLTRADNAMYYVKRNGKNEVKVV